MNRWLAETPIDDQAGAWSLIVLACLLLIGSGFLLATAVLGKPEQDQTADDLGD